MKQKVLVGALVATGVVGAVVLSLRTPPGPVRESAAPVASPGCRFSGKERLAYAVATTMVVRDSSEQSTRQRIGGRLSLAPLRKDPTGWILAGSFDPETTANANPANAASPSVEEGGLAAMQFLVTVSETCRFEAFAYQPGATGGEARHLEAFLRTFEVAFAKESPPPQKWSALHRDENGTFSADYELRSGTYAETAIVARSAQRYLPGHGRHVRLTRSTADLKVSSARPWLESMTGEARYEADFLGKHIVMDASSTLEVAPFVGDAVFASAAWDKFTWGMPHQEKQKAPQHQAELIQVSGSDAHAAALELFLAEIADPAHDKSFTYLKDWLRSRPGAADELFSLLKAGKADKRLVPFLFLALREADTKETRAVLVRATRERELSQQDRERAMIALGGSPSPNTETATALASLARVSRGSDGDVEMGGVAMRSLGRLAGKGAPKEVKAVAVALIDEKLRETSTDSTRAALDAIGNSRDTTLIDRVKGRVDDADPGVREAAAGALRGMGRPQAQPILTERLTQESDPRVQGSLATSLQENAEGVYSAEAVKATADLLAQGPNEGLRALLISILGEASKTRPEASSALLAWLPRETKPVLIQLIGRYLTPAQMSVALGHR